MRKEIQTAAPATSPAAPSSAKIPAPTMAPTPMKAADLVDRWGRSRTVMVLDSVRTAVARRPERRMSLLVTGQGPGSATWRECLLVALVPAQGGGRHEEDQPDDGEPEQALDHGARDGDHQPDDEQQPEESEHGILPTSALSAAEA